LEEILSIEVAHINSLITTQSSRATRQQKTGESVIASLEALAANMEGALQGANVILTARKDENVAWCEVSERVSRRLFLF
jgi:SpoVK/Ycf46/Vps4 family AAA+-type ATPase